MGVTLPVMAPKSSPPSKARLFRVEAASLLLRASNGEERQREILERRGKRGGKWEEGKGRIRHPKLQLQEIAPEAEVDVETEPQKRAKMEAIWRPNLVSSTSGGL